MFSMREASVAIGCMIGLLLFTAAGCEKQDDPGESTTPQENEELIKIPVTEYFLSGTGCGWVTEHDVNHLIVINSNRELEKQIMCTDVDYPAIDFSKYTLLLAVGSGSCCGVANVSAVLFQIKEKDYLLEVSYRLKFSQFKEPWAIVVLTAKIANDANIKLNVKEL